MWRKITLWIAKKLLNISINFLVRHYDKNGNNALEVSEIENIVADFRKKITNLVRRIRK